MTGEVVGVGRREEGGIVGIRVAQGGGEADHPAAHAILRLGGPDASAMTAVIDLDAPGHAPEFVMGVVGLGRDLRAGVIGVRGRLAVYQAPETIVGIARVIEGGLGRLRDVAHGVILIGDLGRTGVLAHGVAGHRVGQHALPRLAGQSAVAIIGGVRDAV